MASEQTWVPSSRNCGDHQWIAVGRPLPPGPALGSGWHQPVRCANSGCLARTWLACDAPNAEAPSHG